MADLPNLVSKPNIQVLLIRRYPKQDILQHIPEFREKFRAYISEDIDLFQTDSSSSPDRPRFGIQGNRKSLVASLTHVQMTADFKDGPPKSGFSSAVQRACVEMDKLDQIFDRQTRFYCGLIVTLSYPTNASYGEVAQCLTEQLLKSPINSAESIGLQVGRKSERFNRNFELRQVKSGVIGPVSGQLFIDMEFDDRDYDEALEIKVDVNTKPTMNNQSAGNFSDLFGELNDAVKSEGVALFGDLAGVAFYE